MKKLINFNFFCFFKIKKHAILKHAFLSLKYLDTNHIVFEYHFLNNNSEIYMVQIDKMLLEIIRIKIYFLELEMKLKIKLLIYLQRKLQLNEQIFHVGRIQLHVIFLMVNFYLFYLFYFHFLTF